MKKVFIVGMMLSLVSFAFAQTDEVSLTKETVKKRTIEGHIYFLASDELRGRDTGSPEIDIAAKYLETSLKRYGVASIPGTNSYFQNVPLWRISPPQQLDVTINKTKVEGNKLIRILGNEVNLSASAVFLGYGAEADFADKNLSGKVAIVLAGFEDKQDARSLMGGRYQKSVSAKEAGALGVIELHADGGINWDNMNANFNRERLVLDEKSTDTQDDDFFFLWLNYKDEKWANSIKNSKKNDATVSIGATVKEAVAAKNVVGIVEGTDPELKKEYVMYSAHYDHIGVGQPDAAGDSIYNGARDNAVGTVTVMSAAENIAKYPTKRSALFVLFTGEEKGMLGSRYLAENPIIPLNQIVFCFNSDNGGYNDTSIATIVGLERTTVAPHIKQASEAFGLTAIDDPAGEQGLFDRSDNVQFARKGIPAPTFSLGFTAFDEEIGKYYHKQADNPETLDFDYLEKFFRAYVMSCRLIGNDPETPFWVEGDKYYNDGVELYKK